MQINRGMSGHARSAADWASPTSGVG
jgi:hypothetical protein